MIEESDQRLCSRRYTIKDNASSRNIQDYAGHFVYPNDAEDIKSHKWFTGVKWERLHLTTPPFVPDVKSAGDTRYFDDEFISDFSDLSSSNIAEHAILDALKPFAEDVQKKAIRLIARPNDTIRLAKAEKEIDGLELCDEQKEYLKVFLRYYSPQKKRRPRDKLLRDKKVGMRVMEVRKQTAFLGYTYRRNPIHRGRLPSGMPQVGAGNPLGGRRVWYRARLSM